MLDPHVVWHIVRLDLNNQRTSTWLFLESWNKCELRLFYIEFWKGRTGGLLPAMIMKFKRKRGRGGKGKGRKKRALNKTCGEKEPLLQCCAEENTSGATVNQLTLVLNFCCFCSGLLHNLKCSLRSRKINGLALSKTRFLCRCWFHQTKQANTPSFSHNWVFLGCGFALTGLPVYKYCALRVMFTNSLYLLISSISMGAEYIPAADSVPRLHRYLFN